MISVLRAKIFLICFIALTACVGKSENSERWTVAPLGEAKRFFWCDNQHVVVNGYGYTEYIDVKAASRKQKFSIDGQDLFVIGCADNEAIAEAFPRATSSTPDRALTIEMYAFRPESEPRRVAKFKDHRIFRPSRPVDLKSKVIVSSMPRLAADSGYSTESSCTSYVDSSYRIICLDLTGARITVLGNSLIAAYVWEDTTLARDTTGTTVHVPNTFPRPRGADGRPMTRGWLIHDLNGNVLASLSPDPLYVLDASLYSLNPDETYLYSPCKLKSKSKFDLDYDRVCRTSLAAGKWKWQEVFVFDIAKNLRNGIRDIAVDARGNVYFSSRGVRGKEGGIWKFDNKTLITKQILHGNWDEYDSAPKVAPDGKRLVFLRNDILQLAEPEAVQN